MLSKLALEEFSQRTAAKEPTPGGGSVAAYMGTVGAALGAMAARFTQGRKGFEPHESLLAQEIHELDSLREELLGLVDADAAAYSTVTGAYKLPKATPEQKQERLAAIQVALDVALQPPLQICRAAVRGLEVLSRLAEHTNPNLISDVAVGAFALAATYRSAWINVLINLSGLRDEARKRELMEEGASLSERCSRLEELVGAGITGNLTP